MFGGRVGDGVTAHGSLFSANSVISCQLNDSVPVGPRGCSEWIDSLLNDVRKGISKIVSIWDDIGIESNSYEKRKMLLRKHVMDLFAAMISEEQIAVDTLRVSVRESEDNIKKLRDFLDISGEDVDTKIPLIARERKLSQLHKELSAMMSTNLVSYKGLVAEQEILCNRLDEQPKIFHFKFAPSARLLQTVEHEVIELKQKLNRRLGQLANIDAEIERMNPRSLNIMPDKDFTYKCQSLKLDECTTMSRKEECVSETYYPHTFQSSPQNDRAKQCRFEGVEIGSPVQPNGETVHQTVAQMKDSILECLKDIHILFDECLVDFTVRKRFPKVPSEDSQTCNYLALLRNEIAKWQNYRTRYTDAIAAFFSWRATFAKFVKFEEQLVHPSSLMHRPQNRAKMYRECQCLRGRILPLLEDRLLETASDGDGFLIFGLPPKTYLNDTWARVNQSRWGTVNFGAERRPPFMINDSSCARLQRKDDKLGLPPNGIPRNNIHPDLRQTQSVGLSVNRAYLKMPSERTLVPIMNMCNPSRLGTPHVPGYNRHNEFGAYDRNQLS